MPWQLFRFRSVNEYLWQELEFSEFYCCSPFKLNDPFDCRIDWRRAIERTLLLPQLPAHQRATLRAIHQGFENREPSDNSGICCFSVNMENHLMWSHYADAWRGVCLYYEIPQDYFWDRYPAPTNADLNATTFFVGGTPVRYQEDAFAGWLAVGDFSEPLPDAPVSNAAAKILSSKAPAWAHEKEFRIVTNREGALKFEPEFLKQVTFGLGASARHREMITRMARRNNSQVAITEVVRSASSDFGLEFPDVT